METETVTQLANPILSSLKDLLKDLGVKDYKLDISKGSSKGDNYLGIITRVKVIEDDGKIINLVIKNAPEAEEFRNYIKIEILHERETFMYENVFPVLLKFQQECGLEDVFDPFVKCYKTSKTAPYEHLIFEDMTAKGFVMKNRKNVTDVEHCIAVLKTYAQIHALSLALKEKDVELYNQLSERAKESYFNNVNLVNLGQTIKALIDKIVKNLDTIEDKELIVKLNDFIKYPEMGLLENLSIEAADGQAVFCHGDCWINNILFKYETNSSTPSSVCILDWQLSRCSSPAIDVSYFIFSCTDKKLRDTHYQNLLDIYHSTLTSFLIKIGCNPDIFTKESFLKHMEKFSKYGLMMCLIAVPLFTAELEEIPDWTGELDHDKRKKMFTKERKSEVYIVEKLTDIVKDFNRLGYL